MKSKTNNKKGYAQLGFCILSCESVSLERIQIVKKKERKRAGEEHEKKKGLQMGGMSNTKKKKGKKEKGENQKCRYTKGSNLNEASGRLKTTSLPCLSKPVCLAMFNKLCPP